MLRRPAVASGVVGDEMKRALATITVVLALTGFAIPASAQVAPVIHTLRGFEVCPEGVCGASFFYGGTRNGQLGGDFVVAFQFGELPEPGNVGNVANGVLMLTYGNDSDVPVWLVGWVANNGDGTLRVIAIFFGVNEFLVFDGTIDTNTSPSLIHATVTQFPIVA